MYNSDVFVMNFIPIKSMKRVCIENFNIKIIDFISLFYLFFYFIKLFWLYISFLSFKPALFKIRFIQITRFAESLRMDRGRRSANSYSYGRLAFGTVDFATVVHIVSAIGVCINSRCNLVEIRRMSRYVLCPSAMKEASPPLSSLSFRTPSHFVTGRWEQFDISRSVSYTHRMYILPILRYATRASIVRR